MIHPQEFAVIGTCFIFEDLFDGFPGCASMFLVPLVERIPRYVKPDTFLKETAGNPGGKTVDDSGTADPATLTKQTQSFRRSG